MAIRDLQPGPAISRRIARHRRAFLAYDRLIPLGDPADARFLPAALPQLDRAQAMEARRRRDLLAHPIASLADIRAKAHYLLAYPQSGFLVDGPGELAVFLRAIEGGSR